MALILGVHIGDRFFIGDEPVVVLDYEGHSRAVLGVANREIEVTDMKATEVLKGVYISCGIPRLAREGEVMLPRLVIEAPREIVILREELYGRQRRPSRVFHPA